MKPKEFLKSRAWLLKRHEVGENHLIIDALTESHGRLRFFARNARNSKKRFAGGLEAFHTLELTWSFGRGELAELQTSRVLKDRMSLLLDTQTFNKVANALQLIREATAEGIPIGNLFDCGEAVFDALAVGRQNALPILRFLYAELLHLNGSYPNFDSCNRCSRVRPSGSRAHYSIAGGGLLCTACGGSGEVLDSAIVEQMRRLGSESPPAHLEQLEISAQQLDKTTEVLRIFLESQLQRVKKGAI